MMLCGKVLLDMLTSPSLSDADGQCGAGGPCGACVGVGSQVTKIRNVDGREMGDGIPTQSSAAVYHLSQMVHPYVWNSFFSSLVGLPGHDALWQSVVRHVDFSQSPDTAYPPVGYDLSNLLLRQRIDFCSLNNKVVIASYNSGDDDTQ
nr:hypothetical protein [Tanacetum cinerariifolium]